MERHVAFLRGMNLGGRRIKNEELRREFEVLGFAEVACFRASGNVIFDSEEGDEDALTRRIESGLGEALGYEVPVFLRSAAELGKIATSDPFDAALVAASKGKLQVAFLPAAPKGSSRKRALELSTGEDRLAIAGRELHWLPQRRHLGIVPRPQRPGVHPWPVDDAHDGHRRADRRKVFRRLVPAAPESTIDPSIQLHVDGCACPRGKDEHRRWGIEGDDRDGCTGRNQGAEGDCPTRKLEKACHQVHVMMIRARMAAGQPQEKPSPMPSLIRWPRMSGGCCSEIA